MVNLFYLTLENHWQTLLVIALFFPFFVYIFLTLANKINSKIIINIFGVGGVLVSFIFFVLLYLYWLNNQNLTNELSLDLKIYDWISVGEVYVPFALKLDALSLIMSVMVTLISFCICLFSVSYMREDEGYKRFFSYLNLFIFFMLLLVISSNFIVLFLAWEGVGLCSYLLIGFWREFYINNIAARKAFIMNRIGDFFMLSAILLIFVKFESVEFNEVFEQVALYDKNHNFITLLSLLLLGGAIAKSAQLPLSTWLPDAMVGPTPVSALIHAATMVTAGVYLIIRANIFFYLSPFTLNIILILALLTLIYSSLIALTQFDIKKILAYSTLTHLSLMFIALGLGTPSSAIFHTLTHASYKALLFLGAACIIHYLDNEKDIRYMGALRKHIPFIFYAFLIGILSISGVIPFSGYFSKDEILAHAMLAGWGIFTIVLVGSFLSSFAMFRLFFMVFYGEERFLKKKESFHKPDNIMKLPLFILCIISIFGGLLNLPDILGGEHFLENILNPLMFYSYISESNSQNLTLNFTFKKEILLFILVHLSLILSIILTWYLYVFKKYSKRSELSKSKIYNLIYNKFYVDETYNILFIKPYYNLSNLGRVLIEEKLIDYFTDLLQRLLERLSNLFRKLQTGKLSFYLFIMIISLILILFLIPNL